MLTVVNGSDNGRVLSAGLPGVAIDAAGEGPGRETTALDPNTEGDCSVESDGTSLISIAESQRDSSQWAGQRGLRPWQR